MLLTNTINSQTITTTTGNGNVIVCGVELGGCSACRPARSADRPSEKPAAKRIGERLRRPARLHAMYTDHQMSWHQLWLDASTSLQPASGLLLGCGFSLS